VAKRTRRGTYTVQCLWFALCKTHPEKWHEAVSRCKWINPAKINGWAAVSPVNLQLQRPNFSTYLLMYKFWPLIDQRIQFGVMGTIHDSRGSKKRNGMESFRTYTSDFSQEYIQWHLQKWISIKKSPLYSTYQHEGYSFGLNDNRSTVSSLSGVLGGLWARTYTEYTALKHEVGVLRFPDGVFSRCEDWSHHDWEFSGLLFIISHLIFSGGRKAGFGFGLGFTKVLKGRRLWHSMYPDHWGEELKKIWKKFWKGDYV